MGWKAISAFKDDGLESSRHLPACPLEHNIESALTGGAKSMRNPDGESIHRRLHEERLADTLLPDFM